MIINIFSNTKITEQMILDTYKLLGLVAIRHSNTFVTLRSEDILDMNQCKFVETVHVANYDDYLEMFYDDAMAA